MKPFCSLLAAMAVLFGPGLALASPQRCGGQELRAMTYNIRLDVEGDGANRWAHRRDLFIGQIRLLHPAILGLQEVVPSQRADLVAALPDYLVLGGGRDDGKLAGEASPLLIERAQFRVRTSGMFWLSPTPTVPSKGWDAAYPRVATWAHLQRRSDRLRLLAVNVHWDHIGLAARRNSASQLREWIGTHRQAGEKIVLIGDFNAPLEEDSMGLLRDPRGAGPTLTDARGASDEPAIGTSITFNGWEPMPTTGMTIDHVLVGPGLHVRRYHALAENFDGRLASDHFPVIADLVPERLGACQGGQGLQD